ncbi:MAG: putative alpha/beta-fold hydrolase [Pseudoalteromonas tetraodonis]|jgi:predicted alpha/beta-fold hydrolase
MTKISRMPVISPSSYQPPFGFGNGHLQAIYPALLRRVGLITTRRERIDTPDGDFLDLDWGPRQHGRLAILSHGLEGNSRQPYMQGMARALQQRGWDVLAWNFRGCSGEANRRLYSYHSGATGDLKVLLEHVDGYESIALVGFSLGGNITLKYLGEAGANIDPRISAAVAFSVPCDLASSADKMAGRAQHLYMARFLKCLRMKIRLKIESHPGEVEDHGLDEMRTFREFDERYTAPMNGFAGAEDYWARCSSKPLLSEIRVPTLLVNAQDDPFLPPECHPHEAAAASEHFFFENPENGGHVGFVLRRAGGEFWSEQRAAEFLGSERR